MDNTLTLLNQFGLSNRVSYSYSSVANAFIGSGYVSQAGNLYFNSLRLLDGIVIKEDVGQGYSRTFLNGLRIFDIKSKTLLCERNYHCCFYDKNFIQREITDILSNLIIESARKRQIHASRSDIHKNVEHIVERSFATDQRIMLTNQNNKILS